MTPFDYGYKFVAFLEKHAGGTGRLAANAGTALGGAFKAKPVVRAAQAAGAGGVGLAAGSQTPAGQQAMNNAGTMAGTISSQIGNLAARTHVAGQRAFEALPRSLQEYHHTVEHSPLSTALHPATGVARAMNPVNTTGNLSGLVPHSVTTPIEGAHLAHESLHGLGHGTAHAGVAKH